MMESMGWGTFLLWGVFDAVIAGLCFLILRETKGMSLEAIAHRRFNKGGGSAADLADTNASKDNEEDVGSR
jgi:hypothetical protein